MKKIITAMTLFFLTLPIKVIAGIPAVMPCVAPSTPCISYSYTDWGECKNGVKTRDATNLLPEGCCKNNLILFANCSPSCESWSYSNWGECINNLQTRTILEKLPHNCDGEPQNKPILTKECVTCTGRIYSNWSDCINGIQERIVLQKIPTECIGEPQKELILTQTCNENKIEEQIVTKIEQIKDQVIVNNNHLIKETTTNTQIIQNETTNTENNIQIIEEKTKITEEPNNLFIKITKFIKNIFGKLKFW